MKIWRTLNITFWVCFFVGSMILCYCGWINYDITCFIVSFLLYGGTSLFFGYESDSVIKKYFEWLDKID